MQLRREKRRLEMENQIRRRAAASLRRRQPPRMSYPLVHDLAPEGIPLRLTCGYWATRPRACYSRLSAPASRRGLEDAYLPSVLIDAHGDDPEFGYRFLADEVAVAGLVAGERRIWRAAGRHRPQCPTLTPHLYFASVGA